MPETTTAYRYQDHQMAFASEMDVDELKRKVRSDPDGAVIEILAMRKVIESDDRPFDPAEFGFKRITEEGAIIDAWSRPYYGLYMLDANSMLVERRDEMGDRHRVYEGAKPDSAASARIILQHLGVEVK